MYVFQVLIYDCDLELTLTSCFAKQVKLFALSEVFRKCSVLFFFLTKGLWNFHQCLCYSSFPLALVPCHIKICSSPLQSWKLSNIFKIKVFWDATPRLKVCRWFKGRPPFKKISATVVFFALVITAPSSTLCLSVSCLSRRCLRASQGRQCVELIAECLCARCASCRCFASGRRGGDFPRRRRLRLHDASRRSCTAQDGPHPDHPLAQGWAAWTTARVVVIEAEPEDVW